MKKIIRGVLLGLLAVIVIGVSVLAYFLFGANKPKTDDKLIVTDGAGNSYLAVVDEEGQTLVAVTDANGSIYAAATDSKGNVGSTVANIDDVLKKEDLPTNYTGQNFDVTANSNDYSGSAESVPSTTAPASSTQNAQPSDASTSAPADELKAYRFEKYQQIFAGGTYLMQFTTNDEELGDTPITAAVKNGNIYIETKIQSMGCKMLYLAGSGSKQGTTYLIIDDFKKYCKMPADLLGDDLDMTNMMGNFASKTDREITVSKVNIGGKELICESYTDKDGTIVKYYFDGETLVRRDNENKDGTVETTYITRITSDVPDSLFQIPDNYGYLNLSFLGGLSGLTGGDSSK